MLITETLLAARRPLWAERPRRGWPCWYQPPGEAGCAGRDFPLLPTEDLGLSSPAAHPTINEQPGYPLNFNDITDRALLIAHLLIWNEF